MTPIRPWIETLTKRKRRLWVAILLVLLGLAGCFRFGPQAMDGDLFNYNQQVLQAEQEMLLYNIGLLRNDQPPHFMTVTQLVPTRSFSTSGSFTWTDMWNALLIPFVKLGAINNGATATRGANTYTVGPFAAASVENPTFTFIPIQGADFAQRFESPQTDKMTLFLEDNEAHGPHYLDDKDIVKLFVQDFYVVRGTDADCYGKDVTYSNEWLSKTDCTSDPKNPVCTKTRVGPGLSAQNPSGYTVRPTAGLPQEGDVRYGENFVRCVDHVVDAYRDFERLDGHHFIPTKSSDQPKAADLTTALQAGYEWTANGDDYALTNPVTMPAWFDYDPNELPTPAVPEKYRKLLPLVWAQTTLPRSEYQAYTLPPKYAWKTDTTGSKYLLVPDGYGFRSDTGVLERKDPPSTPHNQPSYTDAIINSMWPYPQNYFYVELRNPTKLSPTATPAETPAPTPAPFSTGPNLCCQPKPLKPVKQEIVTDDQMKQFCFPDPSSLKRNQPCEQQDVFCDSPQFRGDREWCKQQEKWRCQEASEGSDDISNYPGLVCGYFKVGNLLEIMRRLSYYNVCTPEMARNDNCKRSIFGIDSTVPSWAAVSTDATYNASRFPFNVHGYLPLNAKIYIPAHKPGTRYKNVDPNDPEKGVDLGRRDLQEFALLYKLYQMSLVDASKLQFGLPITISK